MWGSVQTRGFLLNTVAVSDDAGRFNVGQNREEFAQALKYCASKGSSWGLQNSQEGRPNDSLAQIPKICGRMSGHGQSRADRGKQGHVGSLGGALDAVR